MQSLGYDHVKSILEYNQECCFVSCNKGEKPPYLSNTRMWGFPLHKAETLRGREMNSRCIKWKDRRRCQGATCQSVALTGGCCTNSAGGSESMNQKHQLNTKHLFFFFKYIVQVLNREKEISKLRN